MAMALRHAKNRLLLYMAALGKAAGGNGGFEFDPRFFPTKPWAYALGRLCISRGGVILSDCSPSAVPI
jgi:hypothetical protein